MSLLFIKETYVYMHREMACHTDGCGYWRTADDHSMSPNMPFLRMFKVDGRYACEGCLRDTLRDITEELEDVCPPMHQVIE